MGVKVDKILEKLEDFINYLENESYYIKLKSDMIDCDDFIVLRIEMPGVKKDDFNIYYKDNNLIIKGIKKKEYSEEKVNFILAERRFGVFYDVYPIPEEYDINSIEVKLKNGVLTIRIPRKSITTVIKKIEIE